MERNQPSGDEGVEGQSCQGHGEVFGCELGCGSWSQLVNVLRLRMGALVWTVLEDKGDLIAWVCPPLCSGL